MNEPEFFPDEKSLNDSVELKKNSKGIYQWTIKLRDDPVTMETLERLDTMNEFLRRKYEKEDNKE